MRAPVVLYEPTKRARTDYRIGLSAWTDKSLAGVLIDERDRERLLDGDARPGR